jgi:hypothetical protein
MKVKQNFKKKLFYLKKRIANSPYLNLFKNGNVSEWVMMKKVKIISDFRFGPSR